MPRGRLEGDWDTGLGALRLLGATCSYLKWQRQARVGRSPETVACLVGVAREELCGHLSKGKVRLAPLWVRHVHW